MQEKVSSPEVSKIVLKYLRAGDVLHIQTGKGSEAHRYTFLVSNEGEWPVCLFTLTKDGSVIGPAPMELHGSGFWTTRRQNPVQTQERAFTSCWEMISLGEFLVTRPAEGGDRMVFDKPGQEIISLKLERAQIDEKKSRRVKKR